MSAYTVEKDWTTRAGFRAVAIMGSLGHRCGYVGVPVGHPLHGVSYSDEADALLEISGDEPIGKRGSIPILCAALSGGIKQTPEMVFDVHGSLTYANGRADYPVESDLWWFGFDCGHCDDAPSDEYIEKMDARFRGMYREGVHRSLDYVTDECESLAAQIVAKTVGAP